MPLTRTLDYADESAYTAANIWMIHLEIIHMGSMIHRVLDRGKKWSTYPQSFMKSTGNSCILSIGLGEQLFPTAQHLRPLTLSPLNGVLCSALHFSPQA